MRFIVSKQEIYLIPIRFALRLKFMLLKTVEKEAPPRISLTGELASTPLLWTGEMP